MSRLAPDQRGALNVLLIPFIFVILLLIGASVFGIWAVNGRQHYKNGTDQIVATAVAAEKVSVQAADATQYAEAAKQPLKAYDGPQAYGSIVIKYPKTWSAYVDETDGGSTPIDGYFQPDVVPSVTDQTNTFALRVQILQQSYDTVLSQFTSLVNEGSVTITPYTPTNVPSVVGVRVDGQITPTVQGSMIILPLRADTFKLWTESSAYEPDFNNNILPNFSFSP